jgi:hypothetical protein
MKLPSEHLSILSLSYISYSCGKLVLESEGNVMTD